MLFQYFFCLEAVFVAPFKKDTWDETWLFAIQVQEVRGVNFFPEGIQISPEKWWLEDDPFLLGTISGENELLNFGEVCVETG